jgi:hypothetical protein
LGRRPARAKKESLGRGATLDCVFADARIALFSECGGASMGFETTLRFLETYAREYLLYLLAFFRPRPPETRSDVDTPEGKVVIYAVISASIGLVLSFASVGRVLKANEFAVELFSKFAYWLAIALALHLTLKLLRARADFMVSLLAVLTVLPVAYALGGYAAYLLKYVGWLWWTNSYPAAYAAAILAQLAITIVYLPRILARETVLGPLRTSLATGVVALLILAVQLFVALFQFYAQEAGR